MTLTATAGAPFILPSSEQWMVDPFISAVTLLIVSWLINGLSDVRETLKSVKYNWLNCRSVVLIFPWRGTILSRDISRWGIKIVQYKKEPFILSQVNRTCPPGQTDIIPKEDSVVPSSN